MRLEDLIAAKIPITGKIDNIDLAESSTLPDTQDESISKINNLPEYLLMDPEVVGYPDLEMQENLYEYALRGILPVVLDSTNPIAVIDIGAGRGDLRAYLESRFNGSLDGLHYSGYELNSIHRNAARQKYGIELESSEFSTSTEFDNYYGWGFCIGSLNDDYGLFSLDSPNSKFEYFNKLLNTCLEKISEGVVFILLNATDEDRPNLIPFPIPEMMEFLDSNFADIAFNLDYSRFQGIYKLTIYNHRLQS